MVRKKAVKELSSDEAYYVSVKDLSFDVIRQRINQSSGSDRREARKELLLKMGAKPEKKPFTNYRLLMESKKQARLTALADYQNERFKKTTLERQLGKYAKHKKQLRKNKRKNVKSSAAAAASKFKKSNSSGITHIPKNVINRINRGK